MNQTERKLLLLGFVDIFFHGEKNTRLGGRREEPM